MDDIDMLLPALPARGSGPRAGSSRPPGKADGGPAEAAGARGGGSP